MRLGVVSDLAVRYVTAAPDQPSAIALAFLRFRQVVGSHYGAGQWLYAIGFLVIASLALSHGGVPRWMTFWFALMGMYSIANQLSVVAVGALLPGLFFLVFMLGQDLVALAIAVSWWRGAPAPSPRVAAAPAI